MLDKLTADFFEANTEYQLHVTADLDVPLNVIEVKRMGKVLRPGDWGEPDVIPEREQFSVIFRGPHDPQLRQHIFALTSSGGERIEHLFLVPIARDSKGMIYEAVFT